MKTKTLGKGNVPTDVKNISRFAVGALLALAFSGSARSVYAQPTGESANGLPYGLVSIEDAEKLGLTDKPMQFHLRDVTLADALDQLRRQSGKRLDVPSEELNEALQKKISLDLKTRSFDEAFDALLKAADAKAYLRRYGTNDHLYLTFGEDRDGQDAVLSGSGAFRFRMRTVNSGLEKMVELRKTAASPRTQSSNMAANCDVVLAPQVPDVSLARVLVSRADDDQGRSLIFPNTNLSNGGFFNSATQSSFDLLLPPADAQKIAHLEGKLVYVLPTKYETWEVPDVLSAKDVGHDFLSDGIIVRVVVRDAQKTEEGLTLNLHVTCQSPNGGGGVCIPLISFEQIEAAIQLTDAKGRALETGSFNGPGSSVELNINGRYYLRPSHALPTVVVDGKRIPAEIPTIEGPVKLVFKAPTAFVQTQVPFSFHDLPLP